MSAQHLTALAHANEVRTTGARIRREMAGLSALESRRRAAEILRDPPDAIARMRVGHFLEGIKRCGSHRVSAIMRAAGIEPQYWWNRRVGPMDWGARTRALTARQREALAEVLEL